MKYGSRKEGNASSIAASETSLIRQTLGCTDGITFTNTMREYVKRNPDPESQKSLLKYQQNVKRSLH